MKLGIGILSGFHFVCLTTNFRLSIESHVATTFFGKNCHNIPKLLLQDFLITRVYTNYLSDVPMFIVYTAVQGKYNNVLCTTTTKNKMSYERNDEVHDNYMRYRCLEEVIGRMMHYFVSGWLSRIYI